MRLYVSFVIIQMVYGYVKSLEKPILVLQVYVTTYMDTETTKGSLSSLKSKNMFKLSILEIVLLQSFDQDNVNTGSRGGPR